MCISLTSKKTCLQEFLEAQNGPNNTWVQTFCFLSADIKYIAVNIELKEYSDARRQHSISPAEDSFFVRIRGILKGFSLTQKAACQQ